MTESTVHLLPIPQLMANTQSKKGTSTRGRKKVNWATASRCTGAMAPRLALKSNQKALVPEVTQDDAPEEMTGVEETPLSRVVITLDGEPYDGTADRVSATIHGQFSLLMPIVHCG